MMKDLTLEDLANLTGLSLRTLRFYMQEGLLEGPNTHGKYARYSQQHLDRLELIRRLKDLRLPLQEIRHLLNNMSPQEIAQLRQYQENLHSILMEPTADYRMEKQKSTKLSSSAIDYIHNLENELHNIREFPEKRESRLGMVREKVVKYDPTSLENAARLQGKQETWTKIIVEDGLEINIRQPKENQEGAKLEKLVEYARKLFGDQLKKGDKK